MSEDTDLFERIASIPARRPISLDNPYQRVVVVSKGPARKESLLARILWMPMNFIEQHPFIVYFGFWFSVCGFILTR